MGERSQQSEQPQVSGWSQLERKQKGTNSGAALTTLSVAGQRGGERAALGIWEVGWQVPGRGQRVASRGLPYI